MRILLLGEFSSLHKMLKEGLIKNGHEVIIASNGDGIRNIERDINLATRFGGRFGNIELMIRMLKIIPSFKNYDVVQLMTPVLFPLKFGINKFLINKLIKNNKNIFLLGAGGTNLNTAIADFFANKYKYPNLFNEIQKNHNYKLWSQTKEGRKYNQFLLDKIKGYIPIMYEYAQPFRDISYNKLCPTIPIPINVDKIEYEENIIKGKIIIFHGISRTDKGTDIIRQAMENIKHKYPDDVEIVLKGNLSLTEYLKIIRKANIVIDQTYTVSYGVNAIYNMAMGKVVLGGGEPECLSEFNIESSPLIAIKPDVDDIMQKLTFLINNTEVIKGIGRQSREYVEQIHDYKKIAKIYIKVWSKKILH